MPISVRTRLLLVVLLLGALFGLTVWYGTLPPNPDVGAFPDEEDLGPDYQHYHGQEVTVSGDVTATSPVTIAVEYGNGETIHLTITGLSVPVEEGDHLRVHGVARPDNTIQSINAFTVPPTGRLYTWMISFLAGLWAFARTVRDWTLDTDTWTLKRRPTPLRLPHQKNAITDATGSEETDHDA